MGGHVKYDGELRTFAAAVPSDAVPAGLFAFPSLKGSMPGVARAAEEHAQVVLAGEQYATQVNDGMQAYRQGATSVDAAYNGTDATNAAALQNLTAGTVNGMATGSGNPNVTTQDVQPDMASPVDFDLQPAQH